MSKPVRISDEAYRRLHQRSVEERRTMTAVVDEWLGVPAEGSDATGQRSSGGGLGMSSPTAEAFTAGMADQAEPMRRASFTEPVSSGQRSGERCACGHLKTVHRVLGTGSGAPGRCEAVQCACRKFDASSGEVF